AGAAHQAALALPADQTQHIHQLWLGLDEAAAGRHEAATTRLAATAHATMPSYYQILRVLLEALTLSAAAAQPRQALPDLLALLERARSLDRGRLLKRSKLLRRTFRQVVRQLAARQRWRDRIWMRLTFWVDP